MHHVLEFACLLGNDFRLESTSPAATRVLLGRTLWWIFAQLSLLLIPIHVVGDLSDSCFLYPALQRKLHALLITKCFQRLSVCFYRAGNLFGIHTLRGSKTSVNRRAEF